MDALQQQLVYCLCAYRQGHDLAERVPDFADWQGLYALALSHKLGPVVFETLWRSSDFCREEPQLLQRWKQETLLQAVAQAGRSQKILAVSAALRKSGIPHALLKGLVCRELYRQPDLRLSGDEDLFIRPEDREACGPILGSLGLKLLQEGEGVTHWGDGNLHIELHTCLFTGHRPGSEAMNQAFSQALRRTVELPVPGGAVTTFAPTDHFAFLVCHALKHVLGPGLGIRALCDIGAFAQTYGPEIDFPALAAFLDRVHGRRFLEAILAICRDWLGSVPPEGWLTDPRLHADDLLADCLEAGAYGQSTPDRLHSGGLTPREGESRGRSLGRTLLPSRDQMARRYPILQQHPSLLPLCWLRRLGQYGLAVLRGEKSPAESLALSKKRTEMMVNYGIFPEGTAKN